ncbi:MAG: DinB family protein [Thermaurantimonas sp.]
MGFRIPDPERLPEFYRPYVESLSDGDVPSLLAQGRSRMTNLLQSTEKKLFTTSYEPGKWTLAQVIRHVIDSEMVFMYRALTMSRRDATPLPSFDENAWAQSSLDNPLHLKPEILLNDYLLVRNLSIHLLGRMTDEELFFRGRVNNFETCANDLAFFILGHELHHLQIIHHRYIKS